MSVDDALEYANKHRNIEPAIYNDERLTEYPIPDADEIDEIDESINGDGIDDELLVQQNENGGENEHLGDTHQNEGDESILGENNASNVTNSSTNPDPIEEIMMEMSLTDSNERNTTSSLNDESIDDTQINVAVSPTNETVAGNQSDAAVGNINAIDPIKCEPCLLLEPVSRNINELEDLLTGDIVDVYDDDVVITIGKKGFGKPIQITIDGLIKHENDIVSGDVAFSDIQVSLYFALIRSFCCLLSVFTMQDLQGTIIGRCYKLGKDKFAVPQKFIDTVKEWNKHPDMQNALIDKRVVWAILLMCADTPDVIAHNIKDEVKVFINGIKSYLAIIFPVFHSFDLCIFQCLIF